MAGLTVYISISKKNGILGVVKLTQINTGLKATDAILVCLTMQNKLSQQFSVGFMSQEQDRQDSED